MAPATPYRGILSSAFPDSVVRHVFAYDSTSASYRLTSDSSGPAAGVRFLIYPVNASGQILFRLSPIGHLDLIDASGTGPLTLYAQVTDGAGAGIDYSIAPTGTLAAYSAVLAGSMTNGPYLATFSDTSGLVGSTFTVGVSLDATAPDVHVSMSATRAVADPFDNYYTLRFTLRHGPETVGLAGTISTFCTVSTTNLTVTVNALDFAQVTNDAHGLVFTGVDGQLIDAAQTQAVIDLLALQSTLFQAFTILFTPARPLLPS
jgi:hypothetical protein